MGTGLRHRLPRRRDGLLLQHRDQLLRRRQRHDGHRLLYPGRGPQDHRVRAAGGHGVRGHPGGRGQLHRAGEPHRHPHQHRQRRHRPGVRIGGRPARSPRRHSGPKYKLTTVSDRGAGRDDSWSRSDSWALAQGYPRPDSATSPSLWLESIQRTGEDGSTTAALPAVTFSSAEPHSNRVDLTDGYDPITRRPARGDHHRDRARTSRSTTRRRPARRRRPPTTPTPACATRRGGRRPTTSPSRTGSTSTSSPASPPGTTTPRTPSPP